MGGPKRLPKMLVPAADIDEAEAADVIPKQLAVRRLAAWILELWAHAVAAAGRAKTRQQSPRP